MQLFSENEPKEASYLPSSDAPLPILLRKGMSCAAGSGGELGRWSSSRVVPSSSGVGWARLPAADRLTVRKVQAREQGLQRSKIRIL